MKSSNSINSFNNLPINSDAIRNSVAGAVSSLTKALEPRLNEFAMQATNKLLDNGQDLARAAFRQVRRKPWYLVGFAVALLVGAAAFLGFDQSRKAENV